MLELGESGMYESDVMIENEHWTCTSKRLANVSWTIVVWLLLRSHVPICEHPREVWRKSHLEARRLPWSILVTFMYQVQESIVIMCPSGVKGHMQGLKVAMLDYKILKEKELGAHACTKSTKYYVCH